MSITIEYCNNCQAHKWSTRHDETKYRNLFKQFERRFRELGFKVIIIKNPRLGSFEISLGQYNLFSKIESGQFPLIQEVVNTVYEFSKVEDKRQKYRELKNKNNFKNVERIEFNPSSFRIMNRRPMSGRNTHSFSSLKHRNQYKSYNESKRMASVLKSSRDEASLTATKTVFQLQQQFASTARSRFFCSEKQVNPEQYERLARSQMMSREERDKMIRIEQAREKNRRLQQEFERQNQMRRSLVK